MPHLMTEAEAAKRAAAARALMEVRDDMKLGIGTGSTADWFVRLLGEKVRAKQLRGVVGVPTSVRTGERAEAEGIALTTLDAAGWLDLTVDGADEVDGRLRLIKGGGGALLQEKIVATASDRMLVIADSAKRVETLGAFPLPVEIIPFGMETTRALVEAVLADADVDGRDATLRMKGAVPFITDCGHMILDLRLKRIGAPEALHAALLQVAGVVETGLFCGIASACVIGHADGSTEVLGV